MLDPREIVEKIIQKLKRDENYSFREKISIRDLLIIIRNRGLQYLRGIIVIIFNKEVSYPIFIGRRVVIEHKNKFSTGTSCIIEDGVTINCLSKIGVRLGNNTTIAKYSILQCTGVIANMGAGIQIGSNSAIGAQSYLGGQGGISIGDNVIIGPGVRIFSENHNFDDRSRVIRLQGESRQGVSIDNNVWVGSGVTILDGVNISSNVVIAAGSVITKDVHMNSLVGGVPAKLLKKI